MSNLEVTIQKPSAADLLITGNRLDSLSITAAGLGMPALLPRTTYAEDSHHIEGKLPTQSVWEITNLVVPLRLRAATASELQTLYDQVVDYISQFSYTTVTNRRGRIHTWTCHRGSVALANGSVTPEELDALVEFYTVTIPCQPTPA